MFPPTMAPSVPAAKPAVAGAATHRPIAIAATPAMMAAPMMAPAMAAAGMADLRFAQGPQVPQAGLREPGTMARAQPVLLEQIGYWQGEMTVKFLEQLTANSMQPFT